METAVKERPILFSGEMVKAILAGRKTQTRRIVVNSNSDTVAPWERLDFNHGRTFTDNGYLHVATKPHLEDPQDEDWWTVNRVYPCYEVGDRLWVQETWQQIPGMRPAGYFSDPKLIGKNYWYRATDCLPTWGGTKWRPSIFMPREACRIRLEITEVRVQRLQEITEEDARDEGFEPSWRETWWQGYREWDGELHHEQAIGAEPPEWMIEPHKMNTNHLQRSAKDNFRDLWECLNFKRGFGWSVNPWVWCVSFKVV